MSTLIHIAEVALLLAVAYSLGWALGYAARRLTAREPARPAAAIPAERLAAAIGQPADPLVRSPLILPLSVAAPEAPLLPPAQPAPPAPPEPAPLHPTAAPASRPGEAWSGAIRGRAATRLGPLPPPDEDAAMRAIEGNWSRTHARALPDAPELTDLGVAVAAAQSAVAGAIARLEGEPADADK
jgi:hypothetical protein